MAIWVDNNVYTDGCDDVKLFQYLYALSEMVARKKRLFDTSTSYRDFAMYMATCVFMRYRNSQKEPIGSCLNYIKKTIGFKKVDYTREYWRENITPKVLKSDSMQMYDYEIDDSLFKQQDVTHEAELRILLTQLGNTVKQVAYDMTDGITNSRVRKAVITSSLLTFLNEITLSIR